MLHQELTQVVISCFYDVYNIMGYGFLEKIYENCMMIELRRRGLKCVQQFPIDVLFTGEVVGDFYADIIVNDLVILELKAAKSICEEHEVQLINYLRATNFEVGLLLNFGKKPEFERSIFSNSHKSVLRQFTPPIN